MTHSEQIPAHHDLAIRVFTVLYVGVCAIGGQLAWQSVTGPVLEPLTADLAQSSSPVDQLLGGFVLGIQFMGVFLGIILGATLFAVLLLQRD